MNYAGELVDLDGRTMYCCLRLSSRFAQRIHGVPWAGGVFESRGLLGAYAILQLIIPPETLIPRHSLSFHGALYSRATRGSF